MQYATAPTALPGSFAWRWPGAVRPTEEPICEPDDSTGREAKRDTTRPAERTAARLERWRKDIQQVDAQTERRDRTAPPASQQRKNTQEERRDPPF